MRLRQELLRIVIEADIEAMESGITATPMSRVQVECIVDHLLAAGCLVPVTEEGAKRTDTERGGGRASKTKRRKAAVSLKSAFDREAE